MDTIYKVTTEGDVEGRSIKTLGYATGRPQDILSYYEHKKYYDVKIDAITVVNVTPEAARERVNLVERKKELERELKDVKKVLGE